MNAATLAGTRAPNKYKLASAIIARSEADNWDEAKLEWALADVYFAKEDEPLGECLCGHWPIREHCVIHNRHNDNTAVVGNVCVKRFLGLPSDQIFACLRRIAEDTSRAMNAATIDHACQKEWLNDWERGFCLDTARKRKLSPKQEAKRIQINEHVLEQLAGVYGA